MLSAACSRFRMISFIDMESTEQNNFTLMGHEPDYENLHRFNHVNIGINCVENGSKRRSKI